MCIRDRYQRRVHGAGCEIRGGKGRDEESPLSDDSDDLESLRANSNQIDEAIGPVGATRKLIKESEEIKSNTTTDNEHVGIIGGKTLPAFGGPIGRPVQLMTQSSFNSVKESPNPKTMTLDSQVTFMDESEEEFNKPSYNPFKNYRSIFQPPATGAAANVNPSPPIIDRTGGNEAGENVTSPKTGATGSTSTFSQFFSMLGRPATNNAPGLNANSPGFGSPYYGGLPSTNYGLLRNQGGQSRLGLGKINASGGRGSSLSNENANDEGDFDDALSSDRVLGSNDSSFYGETSGVSKLNAASAPYNLKGNISAMGQSFASSARGGAGGEQGGYNTRSFNLPFNNSNPFSFSSILTPTGVKRGSEKGGSIGGDSAAYDPFRASGSQSGFSFGMYQGNIGENYLPPVYGKDIPRGARAPPPGFEKN
eukprot:TRINITY_DN4419_c0_g2_i1.p1 TRINITY_DN4419_c0_g2~~TRINITY_DN4419_c0_g2_i1.p1  ORF type:complete len:422 (+),score=87.21 TRINITY_DN4419_c0_g2_i1:66-1331(+)